MSNRIPLPPPALTQRPSGNVYFSPQQMTAYADDVRRAALAEGYDAGFSSSEDCWNGDFPSGVWAKDRYLIEKAQFLKDAMREAE